MSAAKTSKASRDADDIRQLASGNWQARYRDAAGRRRSLGTFPNKTEARHALTRQNAAMLRGDHRDPKAGRVTLEAFGTRWLDSHEGHLAATTKASYRSILDTMVLSRMIGKRQVGLGTYALRDITPTVVRDWQAKVQAEGVGASRSGKALGLLRQILDAAVDDGLILTNPAARVKRHRLPAPDPVTLGQAEARRLLAAIPEQWTLLTTVLLYGGLRFSEAVGLRRRDFDELNGCLIVAEAVTEISGKHVRGSTKSHQRRDVTLPPFLIALVKERLREMPDNADALLFPNKAGGYLYYRTYRRNAWDPAREKAGKAYPRLRDATPHDLRATCASWVAAEHGPVEAARRLGHSNASITTRHYARPLEGGAALVAASLEAAWQEEQAVVVDGAGGFPEGLHVVGEGRTG